MIAAQFLIANFIHNELQLNGIILYFWRLLCQLNK